MPTNEEIIKSLQADKNQIRNAANRNTKWHRKVIKWLLIACGILALELILLLLNHQI